AARTPDAHLVSALHRAFDLPFHRQSGAERVFELAVGRGAAREPPRQRQPAFGGDDHRPDAVADRDLNAPLGVLPLVALDRRFALAADVHERHFWTDGDDGAFERLTLLVALRLDRRLEHRREIFARLAHRSAPRAITNIYHSSALVRALVRHVGRLPDS